MAKSKSKSKPKEKRIDQPDKNGYLVAEYAPGINKGLGSIGTNIKKTQLSRFKKLGDQFSPSEKRKLKTKVSQIQHKRRPARFRKF